MAVELLPGEADQQRFGLPDVLLLDWDVLDSWDADRLDALEQKMGGRSIDEVKMGMARRKARGVQSGVWLACQMSGDPALAQISWASLGGLQTQEVEAKRVGDAGPPVDGSPGSESGETTAESPPASTPSPEGEPSENS